MFLKINADKCMTCVTVNYLECVTVSESTVVCTSRWLCSTANRNKTADIK